MKSFLTVAFIFSFLLFSTPVISQVSEIIRTGRPGQSFGPFTVGKRILQFQGGIGYISNKSGEVYKFDALYENLVLRYGIKENIEISGAFGYSSGKTEILGLENKISGVNQFDLGYRIHLFERPSGFAASWQTRARLYFARDEEFYWEDNDFGFVSTISMGLPLGRSAVTANVGTSDQVPFLYVVNYSFGISDSFSTFVELYGSYEHQFNNNIDAGFGYLVNEDLLLDLYAGIDLQEGMDAFFIEGGFSYRLVGLR